MHQLLHLSDSVEQLGPLFTFSCFDHESCNGLLVKMVHSNCGIDKQIMYTFSAMQRMCSLAAKSNAQLEYLECIKTLLKPASCDQTKLLGSSDILRVNTTIADQLKQYMQNIPDCVGRYARLQVNNEVYHADIYERPTRYNNTAISFILPSSNKQKFGIISSFLSVSQDILILL